jgi:uncharacterized membrane protein
MKELFGLPAHPLLVHSAVVLVPLACLVTVVTALVPKWRSKLALPSVIAGFIGLVATLLAVNSGEAFEDELEEVIGDVAERHAELGETTRILVLVLFLSQLALYAYGRWADRRRNGAPPAAIGHVLAAVTLVFAVLSTVWMARTGHEGADIVWGPTWDAVTDDDVGG